MKDCTVGARAHDLLAMSMPERSWGWQILTSRPGCRSGTLVICRTYVCVFYIVFNLDHYNE